MEPAVKCLRKWYADAAAAPQAAGVGRHSLCRLMLLLAGCSELLAAGQAERVLAAPLRSVAAPQLAVLLEALIWGAEPAAGKEGARCQVQGAMEVHMLHAS